MAICLALGGSACGGDDSDDLSDASAAAIEEIDAICEEWRETLDERGEFPMEGFDPENPKPEDLPAVGNYFAAGHPAAEEAIAALRELSAPAEIEAEAGTLVSVLEQQLEHSKTQASAAQAGDVAAFTATLDNDASSLEAVEEAADELGVPRCAF